MRVVSPTATAYGPTLPCIYFAGGIAFGSDRTAPLRPLRYQDHGAVMHSHTTKGKTAACRSRRRTGRRPEGATLPLYLGTPSKYKSAHRLPHSAQEGSGNNAQRLYTATRALTGNLHPSVLRTSPKAGGGRRRREPPACWRNPRQSACPTQATRASWR